MPLSEFGIEALSVLDSMHQHIALLDSQGTITAVNRAWREFGLRQGAAGGSENPVGVNYLQVCAASSEPHQATQARAGIEAVLAGGQALFEMEYPRRVDDEERRYVMRVSPLAGQRRGVVVSHEDITARWQLGQQRAGLLNELLAIKSALDAHAIVAITDGKGRITYVNDKFCAISKWSREDLIGRDHRIINSGHHAKAFIRELWDTIRAGRIWKGELKNVAKDGSIYWVDTTIVPMMGADGTPCQYTAIRAEITQKKLLEEHHETMLDELQVANRELSEFAYVVSHDLKAPLRGISSLATWLVQDHAAQLGDDGVEKLNLISARVKRLAGLIDAILTYSRAGKTQVERTLVALDPLVRSIVDLLAPPPHIEVRILTPLPRLKMQAAKMQQVFQNLLSNAIDFMDKPQGVVGLSCQREGADWQFSVADNGPGIDARHFERIFHLFQTLDSRDDRERTGVGLALVKKIVELEGGRLWVVSTLGSGSTFHFTLPATEEPPHDP
jgi:PAS domain S-box-containing protein